MNRRHFLMTSATAMGTALGATKSPNDTVRIACVGLRGRAPDHVQPGAGNPELPASPSPSGRPQRPQKRTSSQWPIRKLV